MILIRTTVPIVGWVFLRGRMKGLLQGWLEGSRVEKRSLGEENEEGNSFGNYEYLLLEAVTEEIERVKSKNKEKDPTRSSFLQKESKISFTIISMILKWRQSRCKLFLFSNYREYLPLLTLTGDVAIFPLKILTLKSFEKLSKKRDRRNNLNIVTLPSRFEEIRDQIRQRDYLFHDKLEFLDDFRYGALFLQQSLQVAVFVSAANIYIYHPLDCSIDPMDLRELLLSVMNDWMESLGQTQNLTPFVVVVSAEDRDLDMVLTDIGFHIPEDCDDRYHSNLFDEIILFPASFATQCPCPKPPDEIYLLMGQSNMSGRGPLFGPTGLLPESCLESRNFRSTLRDVQNEFISSLFDSSSSLPPSLGQLPLDVTDQEEEVLVQYSDSYANRILSYDMHSMIWRYGCPSPQIPLISNSPVNNVLTLHESVDILKTVGLGPGITFASRSLDLNQVCLSLIVCLTVLRIFPLLVFCRWQLVPLQSLNGCLLPHHQLAHIHSSFLREMSMLHLPPSLCLLSYFPRITTSSLVL
jgi:hypothetical protein